MKFSNTAYSCLAASVLYLTVTTGHAQPIYDINKVGMQKLPLVEGCNVPGGLRPITSSDGPNDGMFWCGPPPYCLTMPVGSPERCHIIPGSREGGLKGVRDPQDLLCDVTNVNPTGPTHSFPGRCPVAPTLGATVNGVQTATVSQGANVTLRVNTASATPLSTPTALTMACSGANAAISPFNQTNLIAYAGQDHTFPAAAATTAGNTACTITATNAAGSATYNVSFNATPTVTTPAPTVQAEFTNSPVTVGSTRVGLRTRTTNATGNITWRCTGIWNFTDTRPVSNNGWYTTTHNQGASSRAGASSTCTFTVSGPGGTATTTATWRAVAASGGGGTDGGGETQVPIQNCAARTLALRAQTYECYRSRNYCSYNLPNMTNGARSQLRGSPADYCGGGADAWVDVSCRNGTYVVNNYTCWMVDGGS